jgi:hypothetical protein
MKLAWLFGLVLLLATPASAEEGAEGEGVNTGKIILKMTSDFAKPLINGEETEGSEYEDNGKTLLLLEMPRDKDLTITLVPLYPDLDQVELTITAKDWKLVTVKKLVKEWQVSRSVTFPRKKAVPKKTEPEVAPPPPPPTPEEERKAGEDFLKGGNGKKAEPAKP